MTTTPDGVEVVATASEAAGLQSPPLLVVDSVVTYLDRAGLGSGDLSWSRIGDGQSNVTYRIDRGAESFVLRRGPRPPLPRSTHDMVREARIQRLVGEQGVAVPDILAICEDESVLGVPFYVMEYIDGLVITDEIPGVLDSTEQRRATSEAAIDTLVKLHSVDVSTGEIATLGRPDGYMKRQVALFASLWDGNTTRDIPDVATIGAWLEANRPESQGASIVHGDFRLGNLMFDTVAPARVRAILDWEMATLGDPLADLGYLAATYAEPGSFPTPMELTSVTREPGYLTSGELIERYREQMPYDLSSLDWYQAFALWKAAIFCEAIYTRWLKGERPEDTEFGPSLAEGVPELLRGSARFAGLTTKA